MSTTEKPDHSIYMHMVIQTVRDAARINLLRPSDLRRDIQTLRSRFSSEGIEFLTKTLPKLAKELDRALSHDQPLRPVPSFRWDMDYNVPIFLGSLFRRVFTKEGRVVDSDDCTIMVQSINAVRSIRQVCYLLYKLELPYTKEDEARVVQEFVHTEFLLPEPTDVVPVSSNAARALDNASMLLWYCLKDCDLSDIVPGHGPGAVATGEKPHEKMIFKRFYPKLDEKYSYSDYFFLNYGHLCECYESLEGLEVIPHGTAKVVLVPKDSRGPRLISMEPLELQWIQQGQLRKLISHIEQRSCAQGFVNFTSQDINRRLALLSSLSVPSDYLVTLDLKDASDRVSDWLVRRIFPKHIVDYLYASRSSYTTLPSGASIKLKKFAPMGSACCFPVEALTFWALAVGACIHVSRWKIPSGIPEVYVYGDDIITRKSYYEQFKTVFEECYLTFNEDKCSTGRFFRESCGCDAFKQNDVTPLKVKTLFYPGHLPRRLLSYTRYINACSERHLWDLRHFLVDTLESEIGPLPRLGATSTFPWGVTEYDWNRLDFQRYYYHNFRVRYSRIHHCEEVRLKVPLAWQYCHGEPDWDQLHRILPHMREAEFRESTGPCRYAKARRIKWAWRWVSLDVILGG